MLSVHAALLEHCLKLLKMPKWDKTVPIVSVLAPPFLEGKWNYLKRKD